MELTKSRNIYRYDNGNLEQQKDLVVKEYPLTIFLNDEELVTLLCSPSSISFLAIGFLMSEGLIKNKSDIKKIVVNEENGIVHVDTYNSSSLSRQLFSKRIITTGCGKGSMFYNGMDSLNCKKVSISTKFNSSDIIDLVKNFNKKSQLFIDTGGVHSACLGECGESGSQILAFHEDVGRHNAIDKIIGEAVMTDIALEDKMIITSGRISSEMLIKSAKRGISLIVSRSAPTDLALDIAEHLNITIAGFVRGQRMNIYTAHERIIF